jgi:hypothetical protein
MAKKKSAGHGGRRDGAGSKPAGERTRTAAVMIRSSVEWKAAIEEFAIWDRAPSTVDLFDRAVVAYARERGYPNPIPRR